MERFAVPGFNNRRESGDVTAKKRTALRQNFNARSRPFFWADASCFLIGNESHIQVHYERFKFCLLEEAAFKLQVKVRTIVFIRPNFAGREYPNRA